MPTLPAAACEKRASDHSKGGTGLKEHAELGIRGGSPHRGAASSHDKISFAAAVINSIDASPRHPSFSYVGDSFNATISRQSKKASIAYRRMSSDSSDDIDTILMSSQDLSSRTLDLRQDELAISGNEPAASAAYEERNNLTLLPCLLPRHREVACFCRTPRPRITLPRLKESDGSEYVRLLEVAAYSKRVPEPGTLKFPGRPFIVEGWDGPSEDPPPPHIPKVRLMSQTARADFAWNQVDYTLKFNDDSHRSGLASARHALSHGDWHAASRKDLLATWPTDFRHAAEKRSARRGIGACLRPLSSNLQRPKRNGAGSAERKIWVLASRLVNWMSVHQGHEDTMKRVASGFQHLREQAESNRSRGNSIKKRWTITLNKTVMKGGKPAQTLDSKGNALMDRSSLHSLICDVAGVGRGGLDLRAQLAQGGESIDKLFDSILHLQTDLCEEFDLTKRDSRKGMCFDVFMNVVGTMCPGGLPEIVLKELFDEFAGVPSDGEADVHMVGVAAAISKAEELYGHKATDKVYITESHKARQLSAPD